MIDNTQKSENDISIESLIDKVNKQVGLSDPMKQDFEAALKRAAKKETGNLTQVLQSAGEKEFYITRKDSDIKVPVFYITNFEGEGIRIFVTQNKSVLNYLEVEPKERKNEIKQEFSRFKEITGTDQLTESAIYCDKNGKMRDRILQMIQTEEKKASSSWRTISKERHKRNIACLKQARSYFSTNTNIDLNDNKLTYEKWLNKVEKAQGTAGMDLVDDLEAFKRKKICEKVRAYYDTLKVKNETESETQLDRENGLLGVYLGTRVTGDHELGEQNVNIGGTRGKVFYDKLQYNSEYFIVANDKVYVEDKNEPKTQGSNTTYMRLMELKEGGATEKTSLGCKQTKTYDEKTRDEGITFEVVEHKGENLEQVNKEKFYQLLEQKGPFNVLAQIFQSGVNERGEMNGDLKIDNILYDANKGLTVIDKAYQQHERPRPLLTGLLSETYSEMPPYTPTKNSLN